MQREREQRLLSTQRAQEARSKEYLEIARRQEDRLAKAQRAEEQRLKDLKRWRKKSIN